jgi:hypothetical protein
MLSIPLIKTRIKEFKVKNADVSDSWLYFTLIQGVWRIFLATNLS